MAFNYRMEQTPLPTKAPAKGDSRTWNLQPIQYDLEARLAYTKNVYGGDQSTYWRNRDAIDAQYDYNLRRAKEGKGVVSIADMAWDPDAQEDDANEALGYWHRDRGALPGTGHQSEFDYMRQEYSRQKAAKERNYGYGPADDDRAREITQGWKDAMAQRVPDTTQQPVAGAVAGNDSGTGGPQPSVPTSPEARGSIPSGLSGMRGNVDVRRPGQGLNLKKHAPSDLSLDGFSNNLLQIENYDLENPEIATYVLQERARREQASFPEWGIKAGLAMIRLFDPTWSPERQIADMTPEQRKEEALAYLEQVRGENGPHILDLKEALPEDVNEGLEAVGSGVVNAMSFGMLGSIPAFREAGDKNPSARALGEVAGSIAPGIAMERAASGILAKAFPKTPGTLLQSAVAGGAAGGVQNALLSVGNGADPEQVAQDLLYGLALGSAGDAGFRMLGDVVTGLPKPGSAAWNRMLQSGELIQCLRPATSSLAGTLTELNNMEIDQAKAGSAGLAQEAEQGYTQAGRQAAGEALTDGASTVHAGVESAGEGDVTSLYRAVGPDEYYKVIDTGRFDISPKALQAKQFGLNLQETIRFADLVPDAAAILEVRFPKGILDEIGDFTSVDAHIFKNGIVSIQPENLDKFNRYIKKILQIY